MLLISRVVAFELHFISFVVRNNCNYMIFFYREQFLTNIYLHLERTMISLSGKYYSIKESSSYDLTI